MHSTHAGLLEDKAPGGRVGPRHHRGRRRGPHRHPRWTRTDHHTLSSTPDRPSPTQPEESRCPTPPTTTPDPPGSTTETAGPTKSWALLAVALAAQILVVLDISVVNTALPSIGRALHLEGGQLQWLVTAYLMMSGGGLLLGGRIADLLSRRRVFLTGLTLFTIASLVSGFADSGSQLIAARAVQGLSAALLTPSALSLIMTTYAGAQRKTALAMWGAVGSLGVAAGVLLGGALTTWAGWQAIFWVNVPIGVVALLVGRHVIAKDTTPRPSVRDFDLPGAVAVIGGLAALIYGVSGTTHPRLVVGPHRHLARRLGGPARRASSSSSSARPSRCSRRTSGSSRPWSPAPP